MSVVSISYVPVDTFVYNIFSWAPGLERNSLSSITGLAIAKGCAALATLESLPLTSTPTPLLNAMLVSDTIVNAPVLFMFAFTSPTI